ncbi:helix-turn-helix domain-containing protein [Roseobacter weihaiensis]|uniref:helix-turn-helix domain-containing protein n=1 Tax=Roseobacter weihaiensis TaxID=2763262 RepID=UPI001D0BABAF|nr:AraC family transcriptional regulator [Roseobacter sp. H9]
MIDIQTSDRYRSRSANPVLSIERQTPSASHSLAYLAGDFSCAVVSIRNKEREEFSYQLKEHRFCYNLSGGTRETIIINNGRQDFRGADEPGMLTVLPSGSDRRSVLFGSDLRILRFEMCADSFAARAQRAFRSQKQLPIMPMDNSCHSRLAQLAKEMARSLVCGAETIHFEFLAETLVHSVLTASGHRKKPDSVWGLQPRALTRVVDYVYAHLDRRIRLNELAAEAGLAPSPFIRALRASTGRTPGQLVRDIRMDRAKSMLRDDQHSVSQIFVALGYATHSQFSAAFRKAVAVTPSDYRKRYRT